MTRDEIKQLIRHGEFPELSTQRQLLETHISWVIICDAYVYKIKKPIQYSFLDFSTLPLRKFFCEKELHLNQRIAPNIYLQVLPISDIGGKFKIGYDLSNPIDFTLKMHKMDPAKRMDKLLLARRINATQIQELANWLAHFHQNATVIYQGQTSSIAHPFNDLHLEEAYIARQLGHRYGQIVSQAMVISDAFLRRNQALLASRLKEGFHRDGHGDLHCRNIFLLPEPQPFDCLEFNDAYRQIDVLNEIAFLCMDLDSFGRDDLSQLCIDTYNDLFHIMRTNEEKLLFMYYKSYRANVRAKVNSLRAKSTDDAQTREFALSEVKKYLELMMSYLTMLEK